MSAPSDFSAFRAEYRARNPIPALESVVPDLAQRKQWLVWRYEPGESAEKKPRKMPYYALTGARRTGTQGDDTDRARLVTFAEAAAAAAQRDFDGVGFAFLPGDGLIGIDLDGMVDAETGEVAERLQGIVGACASYTEWSPSGRGVHIFVAGETATFKSDKVGIEVFCGRQFFTFTGRQYADTPHEVRPIDDAVLRRLRLTVKGRPSPPAATAPAEAPKHEMGGRVRSAAEAVALAEEALTHVPPDDYKVWIDIGLACKAELGSAGYLVWDAWSARSPKYAGADDTAKRWAGFKPEKITLGTLFSAAEAAGWESPWEKAKKRKPRQRAAQGRARAPAGEGVEAPSSAAEVLPTAEPACADGGEVADDAWRLDLLRKESGGLIDCRENVYSMLAHHPAWRGVIQINEFSRRVEKRTPPPWPNATRGEWDDNDTLRLGMWLAEHERLIVKSVDNLGMAVKWVASERSFHPVREYLDGLVWDGVTRLDDWLTDCLGVRKTEYAVLSGRLFLIGMVARIYKPGCRMRSMPILEGEQYKGKSTALQILAGEWFGDTPLDLRNKDSYQMIQGVWLYEFGELDAFNRAESTLMKTFVASPSDKFRAPYDRAPKDWPRQCVFSGTTNHDEYFKDPTGNTRYWPWRCMVDGDIDHDKLAAMRDQLFAEAVVCFKRGDRWHPTAQEQKQLFDPVQEDRMLMDAWEPLIWRWLRKEARLKVAMDELLFECLKIEPAKLSGTKQEVTRIGSIMVRLGWRKKRETGGARGYFYEPPADWTAAPGAAGDRENNDEPF